MRTTITMSGMKELDAALAEFKKATARSIANRALKKAAAPILAEAMRLVPVSTGNLRDSLQITTKKPPGHASKAAYHEAMKAGFTRAQAGAIQRDFNRENPGAFAEVFVAAGPLAQAWPQEIGTANMPPKPFLRPALEAERFTALGLIADELRIEIDKAASRARRKAMRASRG